MSCLLIKDGNCKDKDSAMYVIVKPHTQKVLMVYTSQDTSATSEFQLHQTEKFGHSVSYTIALSNF